MIAAIVLAILGLGFVIAEIFFVSFGLFAVVAGALTLAADILAFEQGHAVGWTFIALEVVLIPLTIHLAFKALPHLPFGRRMLLEGRRNAGRAVPSLDHLEGQEGTALTDLRPAGTALLGDERTSVVSLQGLLPAGTRIVVVSVEGVEVRVRPAPR
jgi:membrane-bound serine protease (ClpP class)